MSKRLEQEQHPASMMSQIETTSSSPTQIPMHYQNLAKDLMIIHGSVRMAHERSGLHFYIACPQCLDSNGASELGKKHLAINVDRYFSGQDHSAQCMKHGGAYNVTDLVSMRPLSDRGIEYKVEMTQLNDVPANYLEQDDKGNWIPKSPGYFIPINILPENHAACRYLKYRRFDRQLLWEQFRCSFCYKENPDLFYRRLPGGFKVTPQGRIIFFAYVGGVRVGWQARIMEVDDETTKFYYHPYKRSWVPVMSRLGPNQPWTSMPGYEKWDPAKYLTGYGTRRNSILLGFDAAVNLHRGVDRLSTRWCGLVEGPLDAARLGPPFIARLGKFMSAEQVKLLQTEFNRVIVVPDNDAAGEDGLASAMSQFMKSGGIRASYVKLPANISDPGNLTPDQTDEFLRLVYQQLI